MALGDMNYFGNLEYNPNNKRTDVAREITTVESLIMYNLAIHFGNTNGPLPDCNLSESTALEKKYGVRL